MEYIQKKFPKLNEQQMKSLADLTEDLSFGHLREIVVSHLGYKIPLKDAVARVREDVKLERREKSKDSAERSLSF
jgi:hypothetical protein